MCSRLSFGSTDFVEPERHDLHQAERAGHRDRVAIEIALDLDDGEDQFRRQFGAGGLEMHQCQHLDAFLRVLDLALEPARHVGQPDLGVQSDRQSCGVAGRRAQHFAQLRIRRRIAPTPMRRQADE